jgi:hypothetical protein
MTSAVRTSDLAYCYQLCGLNHVLTDPLSRIVAAYKRYGPDDSFDPMHPKACQATDSKVQLQAKMTDLLRCALLRDRARTLYGPFAKPGYVTTLASVWGSIDVCLQRMVLLQIPPDFIHFELASGCTFYRLVQIMIQEYHEDKMTGRATARARYD